MRYVLLIIVLLFPLGCTSPDFDTSVQVVAWLKSLDPNAEVIEVQCTGSVEQPPGSGIWKPWPHTETLTAKDVLASYEGAVRAWTCSPCRSAPTPGASESTAWLRLATWAPC